MWLFLSPLLPLLLVAVQMQRLWMLPPLLLLLALVLSALVLRWGRGRWLQWPPARWRQSLSHCVCGQWWRLVCLRSGGGGGGGGPHISFGDRGVFPVKLYRRIHGFGIESSYRPHFAIQVCALCGEAEHLDSVIDSILRRI
mmetsp:Transcript_46411/g.79072  ORF Transcript_46411/g.79072 Transcript_46411/m.79072 type:complete len:141 (-) Transcript_46411:147-569(-)